MTTKTIFVAYDGNEFESEFDCRLYERECRVKPMFESNAIVMWDRNREKTTVLNEAFYVSVKSLPAAEILQEICWEEDCVCPCYSFENEKLVTGEFYFDEDYSRWKSFEQLRLKYNSLYELFAS